MDDDQRVLIALVMVGFLVVTVLSIGLYSVFVVFFQGGPSESDGTAQNPINEEEPPDGYNITPDPEATVDVTKEQNPNVVTIRITSISYADRVVIGKPPNSTFSQCSGVLINNTCRVSEVGATIEITNLESSDVVYVAAENPDADLANIIRQIRIGSS